MTNAHDDPFEYQSGFGNTLATEARDGALPREQNTPRRPPFGLYAEQLNGTPFTQARAENYRTWLYRLQPLSHARSWERVSEGAWSSSFEGASTSPEVMRWWPLEMGGPGRDLIEGVETLAGAGGPTLQRGMAIHAYTANRDMEGVFANSDGELLIIPQAGTLRVRTELGWLQLRPGEIGLIPRGVRFRARLEQATARGWLVELYEGRLRLPERGPIGANGLADERHFLAPVASYDARAQETAVVIRRGGQHWRTVAPRAPFDVVAWHGREAPYKYDLRRFNAMGSVTFDHPDPSIHTVLTAPSSSGGSALDLAAFVGRWEVAEGTFRPPFLHRNAASEFNAVVQNPGSEAWPGGASSFTPAYSPHSVSAATYRRALERSDAEAERPARGSSEALWIQLESVYPLRVTSAFVAHARRDRGFREAFEGYPLGSLAEGDDKK